MNFKKCAFALTANAARFPQSIVLRNIRVAVYCILWLLRKTLQGANEVSD